VNIASRIGSGELAELPEHRIAFLDLMGEAGGDKIMIPGTILIRNDNRTTSAILQYLATRSFAVTCWLHHPASG
jgi:hypothetical protein